MGKGVAKSIEDAYRYIYKKGSCSRQMLTEDLHISRPTVANYLNELKDRGLIQFAGEMESTGGRKAESIQINPQARFAMGIDITAHHMTAVIVDLNLNILDNARLSIKFADADYYYNTIGECIRNMLEQFHADKNNFLGIGVSLPAIISEDHRIIKYMTVLHASDNRLEKLQERIPYPLLLFNDANSAGWTELWVRGKKQPMIYLSLSNSVGGAILMKKIYTGQNCRGGEFGHMTIIPNGRRCYCGKNGCLDAYCSALNLTDFSEGDLKTFFQLLKASEHPGIQRVFQEYLEYLAIGINNLRLVFDCDVVLGGTVGPYLLDYLPAIRELVLEKNPFETNADFLKISTFTTASSAVGAAIYFVDHFVQNIR